MTNTAASSMATPRVVRILIVEDEYIIAANLQENLEALGYRVLAITASAELAILRATELRPDLVLMDIRLQGEMDGIQAAEEIWHRLQIPVIYVTGHSDTSTLERAKATFPFGYILKPVKEKELYMAIETTLTRYEREQFFSTVLHRIGDGVVVVDTQYRVVYLNQMAEMLTGWSSSEAKEQDLMTVLNLIDEETCQPIENPVSMALEQNTVVYLNQRVLLITKNGTIFPVSDSVALLNDGQGNLTGAVLVFRDDTQRRLQEERNLAIQQAEKLQKLNQLKDDFLSTVSHELRTPLANIKMAIRMLEVVLDQQQEGGSGENRPSLQRIPRYMEILREQCNQQLSLVNDLLDLQQLEAEIYPVVLESIPLREWILSHGEVFQERTQSREQQLQVVLPSELPLLVSDINILTRIFTELLMNACKYTPPGREIIVTALTQPDNRIQLRVCNTGVEIAADELPRIFDKFYRIPRSDRYHQGGTGLGLALIKKQVAYLGGSIRAESSPGQTCFIVELPIPPQDGL